MHQAANPRDMPDVIHPILKNATNKNVTGEKRFNNPHHAPPCGPLQPQSGMENFQPQILADIGRRNMLVLRLRSCTIPCWICNLHQFKRSIPAAANIYNCQLNPAPPAVIYNSWQFNHEALLMTTGYNPARQAFFALF
jgi:hypothetical protein